MTRLGGTSATPIILYALVRTWPLDRTLAPIENALIEVVSPRSQWVVHHGLTLHLPVCVCERESLAVRRKSILRQ